MTIAEYIAEKHASADPGNLALRVEIITALVNRDPGRITLDIMARNIGIRPPFGAISVDAGKPYGAKPVNQE